MAGGVHQRGVGVLLDGARFGAESAVDVEKGFALGRSPGFT